MPPLYEDTEREMGKVRCERCGGTGRLETDIGVKPCHACCGTGLDVIAKSKKTMDYLADK